MNRYLSSFNGTAPRSAGQAHEQADPDKSVATQNLGLPAMGRILLVVPNSSWRREMANFLQRMGYSVLTAVDDVTGLGRFFQAGPFDLVLVAADMPGLNGLNFCAKLRRSNHVPIILLHEHCDIGLLTHCIELGADDCLDRSTAWAVLHARIQAIIQRSSVFRQPAREEAVAAEDIMIAHGMVTVGDHPVDLTPLEVQLLRCLMDRAGQPVSSFELLQKVWGYDDNARGLVRVAIRRLRQKIERDPNQPDYITTVPGIGYCFGPLLTSLDRQRPRDGLNPAEGQPAPA